MTPVLMPGHLRHAEAAGDGRRLETYGGRTPRFGVLPPARQCMPPFCVSAPAVAAASPMPRLSLRALASRRGGRSEDPRGAALAPGGAMRPIPRFAPDAPVGEQMAQAQVGGQVQQRHLVPEMGPHPFLPPPLHGVGIGPQATGDLRPAGPIPP